MRFLSFIQKIVDSTASDWNPICCWGHGSGPSYRNSFEVETLYGAMPRRELVSSSHSWVASYLEDLSITLAWGLIANEDYSADWTRQFPDQHAASQFVDFFYMGALVHRELCISVDGGGAKLPKPQMINGVLDVPRSYDRLLRLINDLEGPHPSEYDACVQRANFVITDREWPVDALGVGR